MQASLKDFAGGSTKLCYIQELATCMFIQRVHTKSFTVQGKRMLVIGESETSRCKN